MRRRTPLLAIAGVTALTFSGFLGAAGASAATPAGPLFIVGYEDATLFTGSPTGPGALTEIAASIPGLAGFFVTGGDMAAGGSHAYLLAHGNGIGCALISLDLKTGSTGSPLRLMDSQDESNELSRCTGLDIDSAGTAWILANNVLATLNLSTGVATELGDVVDPDAGEAEFPNFEALASSSNGTLYGLTTDGYLYRIHPTEAGPYAHTVRGEFVGDTGISEHGDTGTAGFDQNDTLWMNSYSSADAGLDVNLLWSFNISTPDVAAISAGTIKQGGRFVDTGALFFASAPVEETVTPAATLPDAGVSPSGALGAAGLLLVLGATALVLVRRRASI